MQYDPEYAKMFRGRPLRFVLPLNSENVESDENLIKLGNSKATAYKLSNSVCVNPELLCNMGCETPRINYERYLGWRQHIFFCFFLLDPFFIVVPFLCLLPDFLDGIFSFQCQILNAVLLFNSGYACFPFARWVLFQEFFYSICLLLYK